MSPVTPKRLEYAATLDREGQIHPVSAPARHKSGRVLSEHLVLGAVARCTISSLRYYAAQATVDGAAEMRCEITRREEDGLYAIVSIELSIDVSIDPAPDAPALSRLLDRAVQGCFIGNSLRAKPRYRWRVNGYDVDPEASQA